MCRELVRVTYGVVHHVVALELFAGLAVDAPYPFVAFGGGEQQTVAHSGQPAVELRVVQVLAVGRRVGAVVGALSGLAMSAFGKAPAIGTDEKKA